MTEEEFRKLYGNDLTDYAVKLYRTPNWKRFHKMFVRMGWMHSDRALTPRRGAGLESLVRPGPSDYFLAIENPKEYARRCICLC
jgi:hypothetical protein